MLATRINLGLTGALILLASALAAPVRADTYVLDKDHTEVRFSWDHLGLSRQGGRFLDVEGAVAFDPNRPEESTVDVKIPLKSIATGIPKLDEHLVRSKEFFDVEQFPVITFKTTSVRRTDTKIAEVVGDLTINGVTKPVTLDVVWNFTGEHPLSAINPVYKDHYSSGFSATTQIFRSDFGIIRSIPYVSDEIRITIETEMHREKEFSGPPLPPAEALLSKPADGLGYQKVDDTP